MKKISLDEIRNKYPSINDEDCYQHIIDDVNLAMKEACKQALELAAENAEVALRIYSPYRRTLVLREENLGQEASTEHDFQYIVVDKDSILNTINQIE